MCLFSIDFFLPFSGAAALLTLLLTYYTAVVQSDAFIGEVKINLHIVLL